MFSGCQKMFEIHHQPPKEARSTHLPSPWGYVNTVRSHWRLAWDVTPTAEETLSPDSAVVLRVSAPTLNNNWLGTYSKTFSCFLGAADLDQQASGTILGFGAGRRKTTLEGPGTEHWSNTLLRKQAGSALQGLSPCLSLSSTPSHKLQNHFYPTGAWMLPLNVSET